MALTVQITGITRDGPEVLEIAVTLVNTDTVGVRPGDTFAGDDHDSIAGIYLLDEERQRKFFVMRETDGRPKCTTGIGEIAPGERRAMSARFPAPGPGAGQVTVVVPHLPPFRQVPFPGTPAPGPSY